MQRKLAVYIFLRPCRCSSMFRTPSSSGGLVQTDENEKEKNGRVAALSEAQCVRKVVHNKKSSFELGNCLVVGKSLCSDLSSSLSENWTEWPMIRETKKKKKNRTRCFRQHRTVHSGSFPGGNQLPCSISRSNVRGILKVLQNLRFKTPHSNWVIYAEVCPRLVDHLWFLQISSDIAHCLMRILCHCRPQEIWVLKKEVVAI